MFNFATDLAFLELLKLFWFYYILVSSTSQLINYKISDKEA